MVKPQYYKGCCSSSDHPDDKQCLLYGERPLCSEGASHIIITEGGGTESGEGDKPAPDWLISLSAAVDKAGRNAPPQLLLSLADGLIALGCARQALMITRDIRQMVGAAEHVLLNRSYQIESQAHHLLGQPEAADASFTIADHLSQVTRLQRQLER